MFRFLSSLILLASPLAAEPHVSDAFGILPEAALSEERAAWAGLRTGKENSITLAGDTENALIFIGPKALVAGWDEGHAVAIALDRHGNLAQNAPATFSLQDQAPVTMTVRNGIADRLFRPAPKAGTFSGGVTVSGVQSARALYRVTADLKTVAPELQPTEAIVPETFATFATKDLYDSHGNAVEDGTGTTLLFAHTDGSTSFLAAPVREQTGEALFLTRDVATGGPVSLFLGPASGKTETGFHPIQEAFQADVTLRAIEAIGAMALRIGPVTTDAGHLLTDGASIDVLLEAGNQHVRVEGWLRDGHFQTVLRRFSDAENFDITYTTILGKNSLRVALDATALQTIQGPE